MMKTILKFVVVVITATLMYFTDISPQPGSISVGLQFVSEAQAIAGVRRRAARRGAAVGYSAGEAAANDANAAAAQPAPAAAPAPAPAAAAPVYGALPQGTVISVLPSGCAAMTSGGVEYQHCGDNYFRAVFQGNNLVYVAGPPG